MEGLDFGKLAALGLLVSGGTYAAWPDKPQRPAVALAQPAAAAAERLRAGRRVVEGTGMGSLTLAAAGTSGDRLLIGITRAGDSRTVTCQVAISSASPSTSSAAVDCTQPQLEDQPMRRVGIRALDLIVEEHVAATVANRPYDMDGVSTRLIALVAANRIAIAGGLEQPGD